MKRACNGWMVALAAVVICVGATAATAQTSRWGDFAMSAQFGSAELSIEKRLFEPGPDEIACMRCKHYAELRIGTDEQDFRRVDVDIEHLIAGYRYYAYVQMKDGPRGHPVDGDWAAYLSVGLGRYELDPGATVSGWNLRAGVDRKVTEACKDGRPASWYLDWEVSATYHQLALPGADFDYWNVQTGPRLVLPSKRDKARAENLKICSGKEG